MRAVRPPRTPALGVAAARREPRDQDEVGGGQCVGVGECAHRDVLGRPGPDAGKGEERGAARRHGRRPGRAADAVGDLGGERAQRRGTSTGQAEPARTEGSASASGVGNARASACRRARERDACRGDEPGGKGRARRGTDTCWPSTARTASSKPSTAPGTRMPGRAATRSRSAGSVASTASTASGSRVEVEQPAERSDDRAQVGQVGHVEAGDDVRGAWRQLDDAGPVPGRDDAPQTDRRSATSSTPGSLGRQGSRAVARASYGSRWTRRSTSAPASPRPSRSAPAARRSADGGQPNSAAHHVVELADAREPGGERDVGHRQVGLVDQQARGLRATGTGKSQRADTDLGDEAAVQVPLAH